MSATIKLQPNATQADIVSGLAALKVTGGTLVLPKDATIVITKTIGLSIDSQHIKIDLNGSTLLASGKDAVIWVAGKEAPMSSVSLSADASGNAKLTYATLPSDLKVGGWVKVVADNALPGDHIDPYDYGKTTKLGQAAEIVAINGNTVTLKGGLVDQSLYTTNVRAQSYATGSFSLENGNITGALKEFSSSSGDLVHIRSLVDTRVSDLVVKNGGTGVNVVNNVNAELKDISSSNLWAGVHSATSLGTKVDGLFAEHVAHGVLVHGVGTPTNDKSGSTYGADIGLVGSNSVVYDASKAAYDFHSESRNGLYKDVLAFDSRMVADFRGIGNGMKDSGGVGNDYAFQFFEYGSGDGRNAKIDNVTVRETQNYSFILSGKPVGNTLTNSTFESKLAGYGIGASAVAMSNVQKTIIKSENDVLTGTAKADKLLGGQGSDTISGGASNDYIWGGAGKDDLTGGEGRDRFAYHDLSEGGDVIRDFQTGSNGDVLDVSVLAIRMGWNRADLLGQRDIRASQSGGDTLVQAVDASGKLVTLAQLVGVKASTFTAANLQTKLSDPLPAETVASPSVATQPSTSQPASNTAPAAVPAVAQPHAVGYGFSAHDGTLKAGEKVSIAVTFSEAVTVAGKGLALKLDNGAVAAYVSGSGTAKLIFSYQAASGHDTSSLKPIGLDLSSAIVSAVGSKFVSAAVTAPLQSPALAVDTKAPVAGGIVLAYQDSGLQGDGLTSARTVAISGKGEAGSKVQVYDAAKLIGTATVGSDGRWQLEAKSLGSGTHSLTAVETDLAGNRGSASAAAAMKIDFTAPTRATIEGALTSTLTRQNDFTLAGKAEAASSVHIYDGDALVGTTRAGADGSWRFVSTGLDEGQHRFKALVEDAAGNKSTLSYYREVWVDHTAADIDVTRLTTSTASGQTQLRGTASEAMTTVKMYDNGALAGTTLAKYGTWILDAVADPTKVHTFTFATQDRAGNISAVEGAAVLGTRGSDRMAGTQHDDVLTGNGGTDTFVFAGPSGHDRITDFKPGALASGGDVISFDDAIFSTFGEVMADARQVGSDVVITIDSHSSVTLERTNLSSLSAQNFLFA